MDDTLSFILIVVIIGMWMLIGSMVLSVFQEPTKTQTVYVQTQQQSVTQPQ
jgi:hypothetical protein